MTNSLLNALAVLTGTAAAVLGLVLGAGAVATLLITLRVGAQYPPAGPFVAIEGGRLATTQDGPVSGGRGTVVLLHGASANGADPMEGVGRLLAARGFRVIAFDRPGFGWSDRIAGAAMAVPARQAAAIVQGLEQLGIERAIVLGHSWAGSLALALALDHPQNVSGLVLAAPVAMPMPLRGPLPWYWRLALEPPVAWLLSRTITAPIGLYYLEAASRNVFKPEDVAPDYLARSRAALVLRPDTMLSNVQDLMALPASLAEQAPRYASLALPVTVVSGEADLVVRTEAQAKPLAHAIPGARIVTLPGVGHMLHYTAAERLADEVEDLANRVPPPTRPTAR